MNCRTSTEVFRFLALASLLISSGGCGGPSFREECVIRQYYKYVIFDDKSADSIRERELTINEVADKLGLLPIDIIGLNMLTFDECKRTVQGSFSWSKSLLKKDVSKVKLRDYYSGAVVYSEYLFPKHRKKFPDVNFFDTCVVGNPSVYSIREAIREFVPEEPQHADPVEGWWTTEDQRIYIYLGRSQDNSEYIGTLVYTSNISEKRYARIMSIRKSASDSLYIGSIRYGGKKHFTGFFLSSDLILTPRTRTTGELEDLSLIKLQMPVSNDDAWLRIEPLLRNSIIH